MPRAEPLQVLAFYERPYWRKEGVPLEQQATVALEPAGGSACAAVRWRCRMLPEPGCVSETLHCLHSNLDNESSPAVTSKRHALRHTHHGCRHPHDKLPAMPAAAFNSDHPLYIDSGGIKGPSK